jgi:putative glutamine amidotransferase
MRPRIGLTCYREQARWGAWDRTADLLPTAYADAVRGNGGAAMLLPPGGSPAEAEAVVDGVHGLLLTGGGDIEPVRYGAARHPETGPGRPDRDAWELTLVTAALDRDLPVLGICRGLQVLNVARGGTLVQYLPDRVGHEGHRPIAGAHGRETVDVRPGTRLADLVGTRVEVAAHHRQAVDRLGDGLHVVATAADGTTEAVELPGATWVLAVQWHPEVAGAGQLLAAFVATCSQPVAAS